MSEFSLPNWARRHFDEAIIEDAHDRARRRRIGIAVAVAVVAAVVGLGAFALTRDGSPGSAERGASPLVANPALLGTYVSTADVQEEKGAVGFSSPVVVMVEGDRLRWYAGCNTYIGDLSATSNRLVVQVHDSTPEGCLRTPSEQEDDLVAFFQSSPAWSLDGNRLTLSNDSVQVALQRDANPAGYIQQQLQPSSR